MARGVAIRYKEGEKIPTRTFSDKQEKDVAKVVGGKQTSNSGATPWQKGDVLIDGYNQDSWLLECKTKTTPSNSISIKKDWFLKNRQEAVFMGKKHTAIVFNFGPNEENHYIIDEYLFQELLEHLKERHDE